MTKQEFLAMSLPFGLKTIRRITSDELPIFSIIGLSYGSINLCRVKPEIGQDYLLPINIIMPILRPLSDLVREIEHNGEKFTPMIELAKMAFDLPFSDLFGFKSGSCYAVRCNEYEFGYNHKEYSFYLFDQELEWYRFLPNQLVLFQKLIKWHFDIADFISKGEAIDVNTLDINPYK